MADRPFEGTDFSALTGTEIRDVLVQAVRGEIEECARIADEKANSLTMSGKPEEAMVAMEVAARIRQRSPA